MSINLVFNVQDLISYKDFIIQKGVQLPSSADYSIDPLQVPTAPDYLQVDAILIEHFPTPGDGQHKFLIKWKNRPSTEDSWHTRIFR